MLILKHLKTLQHVSIIIQIIFREFVGSLLKSMNLRIFKIVKGQLWWCSSITFGVCAWRSVWGGMLQSNILPHTEHHGHTPNVMLSHHHNWPFTVLKILRFSDFNKEPTSSLKMIWIMIETCCSVFKYFNINILD